MTVFTILQNFITIRQKEPCLGRKYVDFQKMLSDPCLNIAEWDLPSRVQSDYGMDIGTYMIEHHGPNHGSIITGCNIHNSRVEQSLGDILRSLGFLCTSV